MFEKVNPSHPDKVADRIAGAIVDLAYKTEPNPKIAVEVLIGHGFCHVIIETTAQLDMVDITEAIHRIAGAIVPNIHIVPQDVHLTKNQTGDIRCGDNGIFKGMPVSREQRDLSDIAHRIYHKYPYDGKYITGGAPKQFTICQSHVTEDELRKAFGFGKKIKINPLGDWTGGTDVDTGATNRKLGSDMGDAVTGGGLHGKDLSKADVSVNIYAHLKAQRSSRRYRKLSSRSDGQG